MRTHPRRWWLGGVDVRSYYREPGPDSGKFYIIAVLAVSIILISMVCLAHAQIMAPANLWKGLIAEATSDGYEGMYAVACCVRNRLDKNMNTGLCGLQRAKLDDFVKREGKDRERMARSIIKQVFENGAEDVTKGATHFECVERYGLPKWAKGMKKTVKIGEHTFFLEASHV
jgi:hypothetical protein